MPLFLVKTQSHLLGFLLNQLLSVVWKYSWDISVPLSVNGKLMLAHKVLITSTVLRSNINQFWWNLLHMFRLTCPVDVVQNRKFLLKFKMAAIAAILETAKRNGSGKHRPIWMKFWHYFSCDIPAFLIFAPKFQSILWLRASLQSLVSIISIVACLRHKNSLRKCPTFTVQLPWWMGTSMQPVNNSGGKGGANSPPPHHWFCFVSSCDLPTAAAFAQKLPEV